MYAFISNFETAGTQTHFTTLAWYISVIYFTTCFVMNIITFYFRVFDVLKVSGILRGNLLCGLKLGPGPYCGSFSFSSFCCGGFSSPPETRLGNSSWKNGDFWSRKPPA